MSAVCPRDGQREDGSVSVSGRIVGLTIGGNVQGQPCRRCGGPTYVVPGTYDLLDRLLVMRRLDPAGVEPELQQVLDLLAQQQRLLAQGQGLLAEQQGITREVFEALIAERAPRTSSVILVWLAGAVTAVGSGVASALLGDVLKHALK